MKFSDIDTEYQKLEDCILELEIEFLEPYLISMNGSNKEILDLEAFCLLSHAAFENFIEELSLALLVESIEQFIKLKKISYTLLCLIHFYGKPINPEEMLDSHYDYIRNQLTSIKTVVSGKIKDNHGVAMKYMKSLFVPLGIDIPVDFKYKSSLDSLANKRGEFAHKSPYRISSCPSPTELEAIANDICSLIQELSKRVKKTMFYPMRQYGTVR